MLPGAIVLLLLQQVLGFTSVDSFWSQTGIPCVHDRPFGVSFVQSVTRGHT